VTLDVVCAQVYGGRGIKNDFGGHDNWHFDNVYAYVGQVAAVTGVIDGHEVRSPLCDYMQSHFRLLTLHLHQHPGSHLQQLRHDHRHGFRQLHMQRPNPNRRAQQFLLYLHWQDHRMRIGPRRLAEEGQRPVVDSGSLPRQQDPRRSRIGTSTQTSTKLSHPMLTAHAVAVCTHLKLWPRFYLCVGLLLAQSAIHATDPVCRASEYCCPDAKKCLTPTSFNSSIVSCSADANVCESGQTCCPLTKVCVDIGVDCTPPSVCGTGAFCHFETGTCRTPTNAGVLCDVDSDCGDDICDQLTRTCVKEGASCVPA